MEPSVETSIGLEIGDTVLLLGGQLNKTVGKLYGFSMDRMLIQPRGLTDRIIKIPLIDGNPDPSLEISNITILKKAPRAGFVSLVDLRAGQYIETFKDAVPVGIYKVVSVDEENDSAVLEDESGTQTPLEFGFTGISAELPFEVIRTREAPAEENAKEPQEEVGPVSRIQVEEDDILEEGQAPSLKEEEEADSNVGEFALGEVLDLPENAVLEEISTANRIYTDAFQRSEMLSQLIRLLPANQRRDPIKLQEVRRNVEQILLLRNKVVQYTVIGDPSGVKPTSMNTLAELINKPDVTMSRKVVNMKKVLYLDHSIEHLEGLTQDAAGVIEEGLYGEYLGDLLKRAASLESYEDEGIANAGMPKFFLEMEKYRQQIQTPFILDGVPVEKDEEVFRNEIPNSDPQLNALASSGEPVKGTLPRVTNPPNIEQISFSITRLLKGRWSRFLQGEHLRQVESAEPASYTNILVFPLSTLRDTGPIRSGILAQDMSLGSMTPKLMEDILETLGEISDFPTADSILNLGVKGNIIGNVTISDWLKNLRISIHGLGDAYQKLRGYGAQDVEFNKEQVQVLQEKVDQYLASMRLFMIKQREENNTMMANMVFEGNPLLAPENAARLLSYIESEPLLQTALGEVRDYMGDLAAIDINWFTYIFLKYPDLVIAVLGQQAHIVAKERLRHVRELYITSMMNGYRIKRKIADAGEIPVENLCPHVKSLESLRRLSKQTEDEPRDVTRVKLLVQLLNKFRGRETGEWTFCKVCDKEMVCAHEMIYIQEFLRPAEKETLHKELIIHFSGGQFSGKFICRVCGQGIAALEFDQSLEFDDEGRPMVGRSVLPDEIDDFDEMLKGDEAEEGVTFANETLTEMYKTLRRISSGLGISPEEADYRNMVENFSSYITSLPTRESYARDTKGKKAQDYDIWYSIRYVSAAAAVLLLNIQTRIPDYTVYYTSTDCKNGFLGYPLEGEGNQTGIQCISSIIAGINDKEFPWNMTTLQKRDNLVQRRDTLMPFVKSQIDAFIKNPIQQVHLKRKREHRIKIFGNTSSLASDSISGSFRPTPYHISEEEAAKNVVVGDSANPEKQAVAWIRAAHGLARKTSALNPDAPISETTCCLHPVQNPSFWDELPKLEKRSIQKEFRTGSLSTTFYTEMPKTLEGTIDAKEYYKLFVALCWQGDNKGLPHKLGLTLTCSECGLNFKENPNLPSSVEANPKKQKEEEEKKGVEIQSHLASQGIIINEETTQDLLNTTHLKMTVEKIVPVGLPRADKTFSTLGEMAPEPMDSWASILSSISVAMTELGSSATRIQIAKAAEELIQSVSEKEDFIKARLGNDVFRYIESLTKKTPRECGEAITAFLLVPFQRWVSGLDTGRFKILGSYGLSTETKEDIMVRGLGAYLKGVGDGLVLKGLMMRKVRRFVDDLSALCKNILPILRPILTPGGGVMVEYLLRAYIMGIIQRYMDPQFIPEGEDEEIEGAVNIKLLYKALAQGLTKYAIGAKIPTEDEIRFSLEKRAEKEKQQFIGEIDRMSRDKRKVELTMKSLGMGKWAAGGSKSIRKYDAERYEVERAERTAAGITDYQEGPIDAFGLDLDAGDRMDGDYTDGAMKEDDY
jgi:hypothetical protein